MSSMVKCFNCSYTDKRTEMNPVDDRRDIANTLVNQNTPWYCSDCSEVGEKARVEYLEPVEMPKSVQKYPESPSGALPPNGAIGRSHMWVDHSQRHDYCSCRQGKDYTCFIEDSNFYSYHFDTGDSGDGIDYLVYSARRAWKTAIKAQFKIDPSPLKNYVEESGGYQDNNSFLQLQVKNILGEENFNQLLRGGV